MVTDDVVDTIFYDNQYFVDLYKHRIFHSRSKYSDVNLHFFTNIVEQTLIIIGNVFKEDNVSHTLTKPIPLARLKYIYPRNHSVKVEIVKIVLLW